jgi:hypothetical protein
MADVKASVNLGILAQGRFVGSRLREWFRKATGERGETPEVQMVLEHGGASQFLRLADVKLLKALKDYELGDIVRIRCELTGFSELSGVEVMPREV